MHLQALVLSQGHTGWKDASAGRHKEQSVPQISAPRASSAVSWQRQGWRYQYPKSLRVHSSDDEKSIVISTMGPPGMLNLVGDRA